LQHDAAIDMRDSYIAQLEQLKRGGTEGTPHAQPPQGE
jgi:hypothetical protein